MTRGTWQHRCSLLKVASSLPSVSFCRYNEDFFGRKGEIVFNWGHPTVGGAISRQEEWLRLSTASLFEVCIKAGHKIEISRPLTVKQERALKHFSCIRFLGNYLMEKISFVWGFRSCGRASADECQCLTHEGTLTSALLQADILCVSHLMDGRIGQSASRP